MTTTHLLLDIEGTTCPINFVSKVLFPYAKRQLHTYLQAHSDEHAVQTIISEAWVEWNNDQDSTSQALLAKASDRSSDAKQIAIATYLEHLIEIDKKSTALKDLQGLIWKEGYTNGMIQSELFPEAIDAFANWRKAGLSLAVYSSGSINAQKLLYQHTANGDICQLFCGWFDTRTGPKKEADSYTTIAQSLNTGVNEITFISDNQAECNAAKKAGLHTLFSLREGNPDQDPGTHRVIRNLHEALDLLRP